MAKFDPRNPPSWVRQLMARAVRQPGGGPGRRDDGEGSENLISLALGTFVAPLPAGWSLHPAAPFTGRIRTVDGFQLEYRLDSYEDPAAARGEPRVLDYLDEAEFREQVPRPADAFQRTLVGIPPSDGELRDIVWKRLNPLGETHVREMELRCPLTPELAPHCFAFGRAIGEWLSRGGFAPEKTELDRVAHSESLERVNFEDTLLLRVPREWKIEIDAVQDGRKLYVVKDPEQREAIWVSSRLLPVDQGDDPEEFLAEAIEEIWSVALGPERKTWLVRRRESLADGDQLVITSNEERAKGQPVRRISWNRFGAREGHALWASIQLVTQGRYVDEPAQIETEALVDREARNALLLAPSGDG